MSDINREIWEDIADRLEGEVVRMSYSPDDPHLVHLGHHDYIGLYVDLIADAYLDGNRLDYEIADKPVRVEGIALSPDYPDGPEDTEIRMRSL